jgi:aminoglycoside phosphotransferase (APT) family kinase protein
VPTHRSFRPAQVLLAGDEVAFIDFDGFCAAEPATDLALFRASLRQGVLRAAVRARGGPLPEDSRNSLLDQLDQLADAFLDAYARERPVARDRVDLWETLDLVENVLNTWEKVRPEQLPDSIALLERHLERTGVLA